LSRPNSKKHSGNKTEIKIESTYAFSNRIPVWESGRSDLISRIAEGSIVYYHKDGLGSVTGLTDAEQNLAAIYKYNAFGAVTVQTGTVVNPYKFTSREFDSDSGLYYYRARYYSAIVGRFITKDPIGFRGGVNFYVYAKNNPINLSDPYGLWCIPWFSLTSKWRDVGEPFNIRIHVTAIFSDVTGPIGACIWVKWGDIRQERVVIPRQLCCEQICGRFKCYIKVLTSYKETRVIEEILARERTSAIRWFTGGNPEAGDIWCCENPFTGSTYCGRMQ